MSKQSVKNKSEKGFLTYLRVNDNSYSHITNHEDPEDEWSRNSYADSHDITGITLVSGDAYFDVVVDYEVKKNTDYYLLSVIYGTGDSFGHDSGKIEHVDLYRNKEDARIAATVIREHYNIHESSENDFKTADEKFNVTITNHAKKPYKIHAPWIGYFEELESVEITTVQLEKK